MWWAQNSRIQPGELAAVTALLDRIEACGVAPPGRPRWAGAASSTRAVLADRVGGSRGV